MRQDNLISWIMAIGLISGGVYVVREFTEGHRGLPPGIVPVSSCSDTKISLRNGLWHVEKKGGENFDIPRNPTRILVKEEWGFGKVCRELEP